MGKTAYLLISDVHCHYKNKENRISYYQEIEYVFDVLTDIMKKYQNNGYNVMLIFMGDIFDIGYRDIFPGIQINNKFITMRNFCDGMYTVLGNHELSYQKNNPFYTLVSRFDSEKVLNIKGRSVQPAGLIPVIDVVDRIEDGEVVLHFNHYDTDVAVTEEGKINIGLFHQDIVSNEILKNMEDKLNGKIYGSNPLTFENSSLANYDYCFFGHLHKVYGVWDWISDENGKVCELHYLASLGRPNVTEVNNNFLERDIPAICVEDGIFTGIQRNVFELMTYKQCVKEDVVESQQEKYQYIKEREVLKNYNPTEDSPVNNVLQKCTHDEEREFISGILSGRADSTREDDLHKRFHELFGY